MATYVPTVDSSLISTVKELAKKEQQQQRHYTYLKRLQEMARELPGRFQQRMPYDLLSSLAMALLDGTAFEIVNSLKEVQQLEEKNLFSTRVQIVNAHKVKKQEFLKKQKNDLQKYQHMAHQLPILQRQYNQEWEDMEARFEQELNRRDMKIILELDQKMLEQQNMLQKAGVPGFSVTNNPQDLRLQMYLLEFILRLYSEGTN